MTNGTILAFYTRLLNQLIIYQFFLTQDLIIQASLNQMAIRHLLSTCFNDLVDKFDADDVGISHNKLYYLYMGICYMDYQQYK